MTRPFTRLVLGTAAGVLIAMVPSGVSASDDEVRREGSCSGKAGWEMRATWDDDERIELRGRVEDTGPGRPGPGRSSTTAASPRPGVR